MDVGGIKDESRYMGRDGALTGWNESVLGEEIKAQVLRGEIGKQGGRGMAGKGAVLWISNQGREEKQEVMKDFAMIILQMKKISPFWILTFGKRFCFERAQNSDFATAPWMTQ